ncbi:MULTISPECIES: hypothetical protein [unclassified Tenacibaculum]|uniref:hypothetical protein n=1 Tax=unclassified Tenacibaculum TaxID=2635139 RepID=UPI001F1B95F0|nr:MULTISPECIES: hypothetical protein [unclassified Tenacibaculum]MCF2873860.1 hypothetical protein [Tenacibaculum sp. Cn5-1]MCF2936670.1 hypothetical protein [Tenacibaculum sp. Cn5-34]MCG7512894.1 hypothetical protein [Tenacibaculum sp. Cn5-46]
MKLLSISTLESYELTRIEQRNIMAKGSKLGGGPDTDGEEDCFPPPPPGSEWDKKKNYCFEPVLTV